jgi:hypothetical protein
MRTADFRSSFLAALALLFVLANAALPMQASAQTDADSSRKDPAVLLKRAKQVMQTDLGREGDVVHYHEVAASEQNYQSDRWYPPFFSAMEVKEEWFDPQTGNDRVSTQTTFPGQGPFPVEITLTDANGTFKLVEQHFEPLPGMLMQERNLNPSAVVCDWAAAGNAQLVGRELYRDYLRMVLKRNTPAGQERLFLDSKTGFPVKIDFQEKHYLWGQRHIEYVWTNWTLSGGVMVPGSSSRLADGRVEISQTIGGVEIVARDAGGRRRGISVRCHAG